MEEVERVVLLPRAYKLHRLARDLPDRQSCATARVAVHFRENESVEAELLVKWLRALHGVLTEHGIGDK